jgi:hypothetical protein
MAIPDLNNLSIRNKSKNPVCHPAPIKTSDSCFIKTTKHRSFRDVEILQECYRGGGAPKLNLHHRIIGAV